MIINNTEIIMNNSNEEQCDHYTQYTVKVLMIVRKTNKQKKLSEPSCGLSNYHNTERKRRVNNTNHQEEGDSIRMAIYTTIVVKRDGVA